MDDIRVRLVIAGRVHGVWFRESTRRQAVSLGVTGWVRNLPDGTVEVVAEGAEESVRKLVEWCHRGPSAAKVNRVDRAEEIWRGEFNTFDIVY